MTRPCAALCLALALAPLPARADVALLGGVEASLLSSGLTSVDHGYRSARVKLLNRSGRAREVTLTLPNVAYGRGGDDLREVRRVVTLEPGQRANVTLAIPALPMLGSGLKVEVGGETSVLPLTIELPGHAGRGYAPAASDPHALSLLTSRSISAEALQKAADLPDADRVHRWEQPFEEWETSWQPYSPFDGVVVTADDLGRMPPAVREALESYTHAGGTLVVLGGPVGSAASYVGLGQRFDLPSADPAAIPKAGWDELRESFWRTYAPWRLSWSAEQAQQMFPVVAASGVPVRSLLLLIVLFVIAIGPLNLFILSRLKRKILLLVTVPAVSLVTSLAVYAYALLSEGVSRHARVEVVTLLEEDAHRATTFGLAAYYSALTPGGGLRFSPETELTLQGKGEQGTPLAIDWSHGQHLESGWIRARVPVSFQLRKSELRRERVAIAEEGGELSAVNGLGADLESLWYADREGQVFQASNVAAGARARLSRTGGRAAGGDRTLRDLYRGDWLGVTERLARGAPQALRPGCYVAVLRVSPFVEPALSGVTRRGGTSIVYGVRGV